MLFAVLEIPGQLPLQFTVGLVQADFGLIDERAIVGFFQVALPERPDALPRRQRQVVRESLELGGLPSRLAGREVKRNRSFFDNLRDGFSVVLQLGLSGINFLLGGKALGLDRLVFLRNFFAVGLLRLQVTGIPVLEKVAAITEGRHYQLGDRPVLDKHGIEEQQRLDKHLQTGRVLFVQRKVAVQLGIRRGGEDVFKLHPLRRKAIEESLDARVGQHMLNCFSQHFRLGQFTALGEVEQLRIRAAGPEEKREVGGQCERALTRLFWLVVVQEQRRGQCRGGDLLHRVSVGQVLLQLA